MTTEGSINMRVHNR